LQLLIIANIIYAGPLSEGEAIIQPLLELNPQNPNISYIPWNDVPYAANYGAPAKSCGGNESVVPYSLNLYQIDIEGLSAAVNFLNDSAAKMPALQNGIVAFTQYSIYGFQLNGSKYSSYPWRDVAVYA
jgi:fumiquinazoline A oxidase